MPLPQKQLKSIHTREMASAISLKMNQTIDYNNGADSKSLLEEPNPWYGINQHQELAATQFWEKTPQQNWRFAYKATAGNTTTGPTMINLTPGITQETSTNGVSPEADEKFSTFAEGFEYACDSKPLEMDIRQPKSSLELINKLRGADSRQIGKF